jgi:hypothetical protein
MQTAYFASEFNGQPVRSILPEIEAELVQERKAIKAVMEAAEKEGDKALADTLDVYIMQGHIGYP